MIVRFTVLLLANAAGLYAAGRYVSGVEIPAEFRGLLMAGLALTLINLFVRPVAKLLLLPLIIITLGLASILVNMLTLAVLDYLMETVTINGLTALFWATLIIGIFNFVGHIVVKR